MTSTIALPASLSETDVRTCEACWRAPVGAVRTDTDGRALLCVPCARAGYPRRVDLFPPFGMYKLTSRLVKMSDGKHGSGPASPPNPGPALPSPPPAPSPPGTPPV